MDPASRSERPFWVRAILFFGPLFAATLLAMWRASLNR